MAQQNIRCSVHTCKYNENAQQCSLHGISVGNCGPQTRDKSATECDSFVAR